MEAEAAAAITEGPPDDDHLPRLLRRRPYRPLNAAEAEEVRAEVSEVIRGVEKMILKAVLDRLDQRERLRHDLVEEVSQSIRWHIARYAIGQFDVSRGAKLTTFLCVVIGRHAAGQIDVHRRRLRRERREHAAQDPFASDTSKDRRIEAFAARVIADPGAFGLTVPEKRALQALLDARPGKLMESISRDLGYAKPTTFSTTLLRAKRKILKAAEAEW